MNVTTSYRCKITNLNKVIKPTIIIYRQALEYLVSACENEFHIIKDLKLKEKNNFMEKLIHATSKNSSPKYDFDILFYKFPSYLRRCVLNDAIGIVSSYHSNLDNYLLDREFAISNGKRFNKKTPKLQVKHFKFPTLYKDNMYESISSNEVKIKLFHKNDWVWFNATLRNQDVKYILTNTMNCKEFSPILEGKDNKYYLRFAFEKKQTLNKTLLKDQKILAVDLGINHSAVCSIINYNGTVLDRVFINQSKEKDRMYTLCNRLQKVHKITGTNDKLKNIWRKINNLNTQIVNDTINKIINFALVHKVDVIVLEYLNFKGKKKGALVKTQLWAKRKIQEKIKHKAHWFGIIYRRVTARNTSKLAYDGSGEVNRNKENHSLCSFQNKKQYNCDLNASYNIGSRYFINEIKKSTPAKKWLLVEAKVPLLENRTKCTLSTLWQLVTLV